MMSSRILEASWVMPAESPPIENGAVAVAGDRILAVGRLEEVRRLHPGAASERLAGCTIFPGLINAHTHLELSDCTPGEAPADGFAGWLVRMLARTRLSPQELEARSQHGTQRGIEQCLRYGVSAVGDISRQCGATRPLLAQSPLRAVSFGEVMAMAQRRGLLKERIAVAVDQACQTRRLHVGITPHAPYSVEPAGYRECLAAAKREAMPLTTHLAESREEELFLARHAGPLRALWDAWLTWDEKVPRFAGGPIRLARELGLLDYPTLLAHVNYLSDDELDILAAGRASVVYCPRTHAFFGHPPHRFREMMARGINVCLGTDSCASSPNLDLRGELRLVHQIAPQLALGELLRLVTVKAARALGLAAETGDLRPGLQADLLVLLGPPEALLDPAAAPTALYIGGERVADSPPAPAPLTLTSS